MIDLKDAYDIQYNEWIVLSNDWMIKRCESDYAGKEMYFLSDKDQHYQIDVEKEWDGWYYRFVDNSGRLGTILEKKFKRNELKEMFLDIDNLLTH